MSAASDSVSRMPRRIRAWSSQSRTLIMAESASIRRAWPVSHVAPLARVVRAPIGLGLGHRLGQVERHRQDQAGALRAAREIDPAADRSGALVQAADAERARLR